MFNSYILIIYFCRRTASIFPKTLSSTSGTLSSKVFGDTGLRSSPITGARHRKSSGRRLEGRIRSKVFLSEKLLLPSSPQSRTHRRRRLYSRCRGSRTFRRHQRGAHRGNKLTAVFPLLAVSILDAMSMLYRNTRATSRG